MSVLLTALADDEISSQVALESLEMHFVWLDDALCEKVIVALGKKLKSLKIGTHGTKLTDVGVAGLLEKMEVLRSFELSDVQGGEQVISTLVDLSLSSFYLQAGYQKHSGPRSQRNPSLPS